ncbi:MAG: tRNA 2-thiouridine(34) synthase MnmA [Spirochaetaceae bacterium]|nr:MAG: tRNA 2-thiouridine(34) synthase MnmA [Spirochaetaceae bacterium]
MDKLLAVALSGGVDSTVAAILLRKDNPRLIGATHFIWPDSRCCSLPIFKRAEYLARQLSIPYYVIDLQEDFRSKVVDDFVATYAAGMTPNPCVKCNEHIRFSRFYALLRQKLETEGQLAPGETMLFATGHYARIAETRDGLFLKKARDPKKDQSYMLSRIPKKMLPFLVFPLGEYLKTEVVEIAREHKFSTSEFKTGEVDESQDACFVEGDYAKFVIQAAAAGKTGDSKTLDATLRNMDKPGNLVDLQGNILGKHHGYIYYTVGQRKGLGLGDGPWYVAGIQPETNEVIICREDETGKNSFSANMLNWFIDLPKKELECGVKVRYQSREVPAKVSSITDGVVEVVLTEKVLISPGQTAVFYRDDLVLGSGIIRR